MPKLSFDEIEIMSEDDQDFFEESTSRSKSGKKLEVRRRLDDYFEARRMKHELENGYY